MRTYHYIIEMNDEQIRVAFGSSLKLLREHTYLTQGRLEEATNVPRQSISVYERGETAPTITQAYRLAGFFGLCIDDFIVYGLGKQQALLNETFASITDKYDSITGE